MQGAKLMKMFKTLTPEECKYLRWFTQSNFFNTDPNLLRLFEALAKHHPAFNAKAMTKEGLFGKVFAGQAFSDAKWRNLTSKMTKLMEDYFVWLELEQQETARQKLLTAAYGRRNLYDLFEKSTNDLSEKLEKQSLQSADALRERVMVNLQFYHHPQTAKVDHLGRVQSAMDDLDHYYFAEKLRLACELKVFENMVKGAAPIRLKEEILGLVGQADGRQFVYLEIYARLFALLEQPPTMEGFQTASDFFSGIAGRLSEADRQFGLKSLLNFTINQANKGAGEYRSHVLKLYKLGLEQKVLMEEGKISATTFINIVSYSSALKDFAWTEEFIGIYESKLDRMVSDETKAISLGFLSFYKKDHAATIRLLHDFPFEDFNIVLMSKMLLIRCYFELFEEDVTYFNLFMSYSQALEKFIKREKLLSSTKRKWYLNFRSEISKIARLKYYHKLNRVVKIKLIAEIKGQEMMLKQWLLEKLEGM